jgi:ABC-type Zn uptake system ZnuABC Zn-binding protein ZnuA
MLLAVPAHAQDKLEVVATLPTYAAIAREVTGDLAEVSAIARGDQDPHFVNPRPSFALWVPAILDRANNPRVVEGAPGNVVGYAGVQLLQIPESASRAGGDVHVFGNPHIHTDPVNAVIVAGNIAEGLSRIDPEHTAAYETNALEFRDRIMQRLFGEELVEMLGAEALFDLARHYRFWEFAEEQSFRGKPLTDYLGGWLGEGSVFRDRRMVCYHKNWAYFSARFRIECAMYVEPKPGIPATPRHVGEVIEFIERENIPVLFAANYFSERQVERVASRTGATPLVVPEHVGGEEGVDDYFALVDVWVTHLAQAFIASMGAHPE